MTAALKLNLSARAFAVALLATAVVILGVGWFAVIGPKRHNAATLATEIQTAQTKLAAARAAVAKEKAAQRPALKAALPSELSMPQVLDQLNALAGKAKVTLDSVTPGAAVAGTGYYAVPLAVVVEGQFFAVQNYLKLVRNQVSLTPAKLSATGRLLDVASVQLSETSPKVVTATLQMKAYYYAPAVAPPAPATTTTSGP